MRWFCLTLIVFCAPACAIEPLIYPGNGDDRNFVLNHGDHIVILGNALAERMIHDGQFEAILYAAFPEHDLVIRNLGYSGDEIGGYTSKPDPMKRLRSMDFGTADQWLYADAPIPQPDKLKPGAPVKANRFETIGTKPDVIIAMFGYNESFAGEAGIPKFKETLTAFIKHVTSQKYNGKTPPRLILCSPIPHEDLQDPNLPDGKENNARLKLYSDAISEVASANKIGFINCYEKFMQFYEGFKDKGPYTINGIHLNERGQELLAVILHYEITLFTNLGDLSTDLFNFQGAKAGIKQAKFSREILPYVQDKNRLWFQRYRVPDGYSVYGDRAFLKFTNGQTNYEVLQRELEVLDQMVANREAAIHRIARGEKNVKVDDSNLPPFLPVVTNKPGKNADGSHAFLSGEEAIPHMTVHKDLQVNLFADEKRFPELVNPVQMSFDTRGRLWVAVWPTYPHWKPSATPPNDKLLIFTDQDNDGKADVCDTFAGDLHNPTGFEFWNGGVIVAQGPDILFLKDTKGDSEYDVKERLLHGLDTADTHHTANSFTLDPGGALYFQEGIFHHSQIETPWGPPRRLINGGVWRYEPRTRKIDVHAAYNFANPHGHVFDRWGRDIIIDATSGIPYHGSLISGQMNFPAKHTTPAPTVYKQRVRPCSGMELISSQHLGDAMRGNLWVANVVGLQGIVQYKLEQNGASLKGTEKAPILISDDPNFRPADIEQAPDGSVYFLDWHNPLIGHMQHHLRDPNRDSQRGRIYRITHKKNPLDKPVKIANESLPVLLDLLKSKDDRVRYRVRIELSGRKSDEVIAAAKKWKENLDYKDPNLEHHQLEALWVHQQHNVVNDDLLDECLHSQEPQVRAAAVKVAIAWRDRCLFLMPELLLAAGDKAPNVRLEAIRAASFLPPDQGLEIIDAARKQPQDEYLRYVTEETLRTLDAVLSKPR